MDKHNKINTYIKMKVNIEEWYKLAPTVEFLDASNIILRKAEGGGELNEVRAHEGAFHVRMVEPQGVAELVCRRDEQTDTLPG